MRAARPWLPCADSSHVPADGQAALGDKPGDGPAALSLRVKGKDFCIGTLRKGSCDQFSVRARATLRAGG